MYWFCHISKWIRHRYTCVPYPEPSSLLLWVLISSAFGSLIPSARLLSFTEKVKKIWLLKNVLSCFWNYKNNTFKSGVVFCCCCLFVCFGLLLCFVLFCHLLVHHLGQCISSPLDNRTFSKASIVCIHLYQVGLFPPMTLSYNVFSKQTKGKSKKWFFFFLWNQQVFFFLIGLFLLLVRS